MFLLVFFSKILSNLTLLVMSIWQDWSQRSCSSLSGQHLVLNLTNLLLEVPALWWHSLPDGGVKQSTLSLSCGTQRVLTYRSQTKTFKYTYITIQPYVPIKTDIYTGCQKSFNPISISFQIISSTFLDTWNCLWDDFQYKEC